MGRLLPGLIMVLMPMFITITSLFIDLLMGTERSQRKGRHLGCMRGCGNRRPPVRTGGTSSASARSCGKRSLLMYLHKVASSIVVSNKSQIGASRTSPWQRTPQPPAAAIVSTQARTLRSLRTEVVIVMVQVAPSMTIDVTDEAMRNSGVAKSRPPARTLRKAATSARPTLVSDVVIADVVSA